MHGRARYIIFTFHYMKYIVKTVPLTIQATKKIKDTKFASCFCLSWFKICLILFSQ